MSAEKTVLSTLHQQTLQQVQLSRDMQAHIHGLLDTSRILAYDIMGALELLRARARVSGPATGSAVWCRAATESLAHKQPLTQTDPHQYHTSIASIAAPTSQPVRATSQPRSDATRINSARRRQSTASRGGNLCVGIPLCSGVTGPSPPAAPYRPTNPEGNYVLSDSDVSGPCGGSPEAPAAASPAIIAIPFRRPSLPPFSVAAAPAAAAAAAAAGRSAGSFSVNKDGGGAGGVGASSSGGGSVPCILRSSGSGVSLGCRSSPSMSLCSWPSSSSSGRSSPAAPASPASSTPSCAAGPRRPATATAAAAASTSAAAATTAATMAGGCRKRSRAPVAAQLQGLVAAEPQPPVPKRSRCHGAGSSAGSSRAALLPPPVVPAAAAAAAPAAAACALTSTSQLDPWMFTPSYFSNPAVLASLAAAAPPQAVPPVPPMTTLTTTAAAPPLPSASGVSAVQQPCSSLATSATAGPAPPPPHIQQMHGGGWEPAAVPEPVLDPICKAGRLLELDCGDVLDFEPDSWDAMFQDLELMS